MDLPTCPACGQSVLDDDVEDCPFCGASMTGKPGQKPVPPKPLPKPTAQEKPVEKKPPVEKPVARTETPSGGSPKTTTEKPADEDPFAVGKAEPKQVVRLHPKPSKGRSHKVVCPMCDTAGFTSRKAAGREVRCPNPDCPLPVFTAPEIEKKEQPVEEEPASKKSPVVIGAIVGVVVIVIGGAWFLFFGNQSSEQPKGSGVPVMPEGNGGFASGKGGKSGTKEKSPKDGEKETTPVVNAFDPAEARKEMLETMVDLSLKLPKARRPLSIRMTAESLARAGDAENARNQLDRLEVVGRDLPHYKIPALSRLAWNEINADQPENAKKLLDEALLATEKLGSLGRDPIDSATVLATVLVAADRAEEARALIQKHGQGDTLGRLSATLQMMQQGDHFDLDELLSGQSVSPAKTPQWNAVTFGLTAHGRWDEALQWAESHPDLEGRTDAVILWAERFAVNALKNKQEGWISRIQAAAEKLPSAGQARLRARVAAAQLAAGDNEGADQSLQKAREILDLLAAPEPFVLPESRRLYQLGRQGNDDLGLPDPVPLRMAALAAGEISRVENSRGRKEQAWSSFQRALQFARATAPSLPAIQRELDVAEDQAGTVRNRIRQVLNLDNSTNVRLVFSRYVRQCEKIQEAAEKRHELLTALFTAAAGWDFPEEVWNEIKTRSEQEDLNRQEAYHTTPVPVILYNRFSDAGKKEEAGEIRNIFASGGVTPHAEEDLKQTTAHRLAAGADVKQIADLLDAANVDRTFKELWTLQLASRLVKSGKVDQAVRFAEAVQDSIFRENTLTLISAGATQNGQGEMIAKLFEDQSRQPMERIAIGRGFVSGSFSVSTKTAPQSGDDQTAEM